MDFKTLKRSRAVIISCPEKVSIGEVGLTPLQPDSIIARTMFSGISSGTDMKTYRGEQANSKVYYPLVPGYENAGEIVYVGPEAKGELKVGDRVMINECREFTDVCAAWGGNVEYAVKDSRTAPSPFDYMVKLPENVSYKDAVLAYLACVALKGIRRLTFRENETVLVIGAGMVGISAVQIVKILNPSARVISMDRSTFRRKIAENYADYVVPADESGLEKIREITNGRLADKLIECSGNPAVVGSLYKYIKDGGWSHDDEPAHIHLQGDYPDRIVMAPYHNWFGKNCTLTMTCALSPGCKEQILKWISEGSFKTSRLPVEIWPVSRCCEAFRYKEKSGDDVFKIVFDWKE